MKKRSFCFALLLAACVAFLPLQAGAQAAVDVDTAIAQAAGKIRETLPASAKVAVAQFSSDTEALSKFLSSNMETALKRNGFAIIERNADNLKKLNAEIDYQYAGNVSDSLLVEIGKQVGAQYLVYGYFEQLGSYLSLYVRVTNIETMESPVIETLTIRATQKLNELLGDARSLQTADDYIEEISRCRSKLLRIQRECDKEIEKITAAIRSKYQVQINAVNKQEKDPWDSAAEFDARKRNQIADIESKRDTEIKGECERITIQYNNMAKSVEISEREIKSKLGQQTFTLKGANQVQALLGKFNAETTPKHWPASIKSLDELVAYKASDKLVINDADLRTEYQAIESAKTGGQIAGEITYCIVAHAADDDFDVKVTGFRIYNSKTNAVYLNKALDEIVRTIRTSGKKGGISPAPAPAPVQPVAAKPAAAPAVPKAAAAPAPAVSASVQPSAAVSAGSTRYELDAASVAGSFRDNVIVVNKTLSGGGTLSVSAGDGSSWLPIGIAPLATFDSETKFKSTKACKLAGFRYFALESNTPRCFKAEKRNNDLIIEVRDDGSDLSRPVTPLWNKAENAALFDIRVLQDEPDEDVKVISRSAGSLGSYCVWAYDKHIGLWSVYGYAETKKVGSAAKVKRTSGMDDVDSYRYYAVAAQNGAAYRYEIAKSGDDLLINVSE